MKSQIKLATMLCKHPWKWCSCFIVPRQRLLHKEAHSVQIILPFTACSQFKLCLCPKNKAFLFISAINTKHKPSSVKPIYKILYTFKQCSIFLSMNAASLNPQEIIHRSTCPFRKHNHLWISLNCFGANACDNRCIGEAKASSPQKTNFVLNKVYHVHQCIWYNLFIRN